MTDQPAPCRLSAEKIAKFKAHIGVDGPLTELATMAAERKQEKIEVAEQYVDMLHERDSARAGERLALARAETAEQYAEALEAALRALVARAVTTHHQFRCALCGNWSLDLREYHLVGCPVPAARRALGEMR